ncbi:peptide-methionine (R)-S-oxide reductase [Roseobacter sp. HKCCA0434]|uniref:peptide-methionine (R)-S-oxide reductase n=1 Tax=Roseobacter sp. HKCCA0434 TaxID=3079297 RepID=UPI0029059A78|nr:peptide-methionine (R)-S-oxide reductase [Roseobacter sp. HKCCA0434]
MPTRRQFMGTTIAGAALSPLAAGSAAARDDGFTYEIERTETQWRELLTDEEYAILREGGTERPHSSPLTTDYREGTFHCRGCELQLYSSQWREEVDKGWVFFRHAEPNAMLMDIDGPEEAYGQPELASLTNIEGHCRRCGSHIGHILLVEGKVLHCMNGSALIFRPTEA